jgi:hypothetical protein
LRVACRLRANRRVCGALDALHIKPMSQVVLDPGIIGMPVQASANPTIEFDMPVDEVGLDAEAPCVVGSAWCALKYR